MFLDVGIVSPLFTCSGWGGHQELGLKIDLFKPLSLLSSPQRLDAHGQPGVWACVRSVGASAVPAGGLPWGWALHAAPAPSPHAGPAGLSQLLAQPWFCSPHKSVLVASACPPALPGRVRNPFFLEMKPPASQTPLTSALLPAKLDLFFLPLCLVSHLPRPRSRGSVGATSPHGPSPCSGAGRRGP